MDSTIRLQHRGRQTTEPMGPNSGNVTTLQNVSSSSPPPPRQQSPDRELSPDDVLGGANSKPKLSYETCEKQIRSLEKLVSAVLSKLDNKRDQERIKMLMNLIDHRLNYCQKNPSSGELNELLRIASTTYDVIESVWNAKQKDNYDDYEKFAKKVANDASGIINAFVEDNSPNLIEASSQECYSTLDEISPDIFDLEIEIFLLAISELGIVDNNSHFTQKDAVFTDRKHIITISMLSEKAKYFYEDKEYTQYLNTVKKIGVLCIKNIDLYKKFPESPDDVYADFHEVCARYHSLKNYGIGRSKVYLQRVYKDWCNRLAAGNITPLPLMDEQSMTIILSATPENKKILIDEIRKSSFKTFLMEAFLCENKCFPAMGYSTRVNAALVNTVLKNMESESVEILANLQYNKNFCMDMVKCDSDQFPAIARIIINYIDKKESMDSKVIERRKENLIHFQSWIRRLGEAHSSKLPMEAVEKLKSVYSELDDPVNRSNFFDAYKDGICGIRNLLLKEAEVRRNALFDKNKVFEEEEDFRWKDLCPQMAMYLNILVYPPVLDTGNQKMTLLKKQMETLNFTIDETLEKYDVPMKLFEAAKIEELDYDDISDDEFDEPASVEEGNFPLTIWEERYRNKTPLTTERDKVHPAQNQRLQKDFPSTSEKRQENLQVLPKPKRYWGDKDFEILEIIRKHIPECFTGDAEIATPTGRKLRVGGFAIKHILERHHPKTVNPALTKDKKTLMDKSIKFTEILPMISKVAETVDKEELNEHFSKLDRTCVYKIGLEGKYKGETYRLCLQNDCIVSLYPLKKDKALSKKPG